MIIAQHAAHRDTVHWIKHQSKSVCIQSNKSIEISMYAEAMHAWHGLCARSGIFINLDTGEAEPHGVIKRTPLAPDSLSSSMYRRTYVSR